MARVALMRAFVALVLGLLSGGVWAGVTPWPSTFKGATFTSAVTGGTVAVEAPFSVWPAVADGSGGAKFAGKQVLRLPGASAELGLSRLVTVANLARGARIASGVLGPLALVGLAYEGITWVNGQWETEATGPCYSISGSGPLCSEAAVLGYQNSTSPTLAPWSVDTPYGGETMRLKAAPPNSWVTQTFTKVSEGTAGQVATDAEVETALGNALAADPSKAPGVLEWVKEAVPLMDLNPGPLQVSGPATVTGPTTTNVTVNDAGTRTENRTTNFNLTYNNGNVTVTQTTTSTVTFPDDSTQTSTETTGAGAGDGAEKPPELPDVCKDHPEASGCAEFGEHDPEPDLQTEDRALSWVPALSAVGACPAPETATVHGQSISISWQPVCDLAAGLRPVVLAVAWLSAGAFVFGVGRKVAA